MGLADTSWDREIVAVHPRVDACVVFCNDGTVWRYLVTDGKGGWTQVPGALPGSRAAQDEPSLVADDDAG